MNLCRKKILPFTLPLAAFLGLSSFPLLGGCKARSFHASPKASENLQTGKLKDAGCGRYADTARQKSWKAENAREADARIAFVAPNDLHGHVEVESVILKEGEKLRETKVGGLAAMGAYFEALCHEYRGRVVFLDAGDAFQGSLVSNMTHGEAIVEAFNALGVHASTFGNHEFDYGQETLVKILSLPRSFLYLSANLRDASDKSRLPWGQDRIGHLHKSALLKIDDLKVGIIGFTTLTTPLKTFPERVRGLAFLPPLARAGTDTAGVVATEALKLRRAGAQYVVLLGHAGGACDMKKPAEEGDTACVAQDDELFDFLQAMEPGTVDAAFAGHSHHAQRHFVKRTPLMQTTGHGLSFSWLDVHLSKSALPSSPRAQRVKKETPHDPVFFCHEHFQGYESCNPKEGVWGRVYGDGVLSGRPAVAPMFLGRKIDVDAPRPRAVAASISRFLDVVRQKKEEFVTSLPVRLEHDRVAESALGNCFTDATRDVLDARARSFPNLGRVDLVVLNSGGIRTALPEGRLSYDDVYGALPFDNTFMAMEMSGKELLGFFRKIESSPEDIPYFF